MAINKNFVVKNGFEVNDNLIYADANTNKVGIGSTGPRTNLDVRGGIAVTDISAVGIVTFSDRFYVGTAGETFTVLGIGGSVGVGTNRPIYLLDVRSPVSVGQTAIYVQGDGRFTGNLTIDGDLFVDDISFDQADLAYLNVTGFGTVSSLFVPNVASIKTGIVTNISGENINYTGFSTVSNLIVNGNFDSYAVDSTFHGDVTINGNVTIGGTSSIINAVELRVQDKDIVLGFTTTQLPTDDTANHGGIAIASTEGAPLVSLQVAGINTLPDTYKQIMWVKRDTMGAGTTDAFLFNYGVGIGSTQVPDGVRLAVGEIQLTDNTVNIGTVQISSGIITATSGIVTYYGDGAYLQNISAGIGIGTTGGLVGYGVTFINLYGPGVSTALYDTNSGIATIFFEGGGAGSVSIGTSPPVLPNSGDLWYSPSYARLFVYYDEVSLGIGSTAVWIDAAPFNVGILTSGLRTLQSGSADSPSIAFFADNSTGLFSPSTGSQTFVSTGSSILNINPSGINVTGITTLGGKVKVGVGTTALIVEGDARITGILTIGTSSITLDGSNNSINVGAGVTISTTEVKIGNLTIGSSGITGSGSTVTSASIAYGISGTPNIVVGIVTATDVNDSKGNVRTIPQNTQGSPYTLVASDSGKHIFTTSGVTVPASVFAIGDAVTIFNSIGGNITITSGNGVTLRQVGTANTGNRTLAQYGLATILCVASNTFAISGGGLS